MELTGKQYEDRLRLINWGYSEGDPSIRMDLHCHDYYQANFSLMGSCECTTEKGTYLLQKEELIFIAPGVRHKLYYPEKYLGFCCKFYWDYPGVPQVCYIPYGRFSRGMIQAAKNIMEACFPETFFGNLKGTVIMPEDRYQVIMEQFLEGLLTSYLDLCIREKMPSRIALAIRNQPEAFYSVSEAAQAAGYSRNQFCRVIKEATGQTAQEFLNARRLEIARKRLRFSNCSIREIAEEIHFSSQFHFAEFFKRMTGMTPSQYRRNQNHLQM